MKFFIGMLIMLGTFLAGYYVGHMPGNPDLFAWTRPRDMQAAETEQKINMLLDSQGKSANVAASDCARTDRHATVNVDGRAAKLGQKPGGRPQGN
jgi:hypothetical protein